MIMTYTKSTVGKNDLKINVNVPLDTKDSYYKDKLTSQVNNFLLT